MKLRTNYLFNQIIERSKAYHFAHPDKHIIRLGVGDVTRPIPRPIVDAMHKAVEELALADTFRGYGLEVGYKSLRKTIIENDYLPIGINLDLDEVFISDGAGSDIGNIGEIMASNSLVALQDPTYPAYIDSNVMAGRAGVWQDNRWNKIIYLPCTAQNQFIPSLPDARPDIIYLCFPNNPTGITLSRHQLQKWVDYAREQQCLIIFDGAYEIFIEDTDVPHSIYELQGAKEVAIEIRSYSKTAGFTGVRCGYTIVPKALKDRYGTSLNTLWHRRQSTKFNGASYISQRGAEATYTAEGRQGILENIKYYKNNAQLIREAFISMGYEVYGGQNAPYIWVKTPNNLPSWLYFDLLLKNCQILCTPGIGFGNAGEGYVRFSAFGSKEDTLEAIERIENSTF